MYNPIKMRNIGILFGFLLFLASCGQNDDTNNTANCCDEVIFFSGGIDTNFHYPNVITPNGDSINDNLTIASVPMSNVILTVKDADKNLVFLDSNYQNNFVGKDNAGNTLVDGKYTYKVEHSKGSVTAFVCIITAAINGESHGSCNPISSTDPVLQ